MHLCMKPGGSLQPGSGILFLLASQLLAASLDRNHEPLGGLTARTQLRPQEIAFGLQRADDDGVTTCPLRKSDRIFESKKEGKLIS